MFQRNVQKISFLGEYLTLTSKELSTAKFVEMRLMRNIGRRGERCHMIKRVHNLFDSNIYFFLNYCHINVISCNSTIMCIRCWRLVN